MLTSGDIARRRRVVIVLAFLVAAGNWGPENAKMFGREGLLYVILSQFAVEEISWLVMKELPDVHYCKQFFVSNG